MNVTSRDSRCPKCGSPRTVKRGSRKTKTGPRQMYLCRKCGRHFSLAPLRYYIGYTMVQVQNHVAGHYGIRPSLSTVHGLIQRFGEEWLLATDKDLFVVVTVDKQTELVEQYALADLEKIEAVSLIGPGAGWRSGPGR